jgi:hypothetical protein
MGRLVFLAVALGPVACGTAEQLINIPLPVATCKGVDYTNGADSEERREASLAQFGELNSISEIAIKQRNQGPRRLFVWSIRRTLAQFAATNFE